MQNHDELLLNKFRYAIEIFPNITQELVNEIRDICFNYGSPKHVVFRIEEFIKNVWPSYKPLAIHFIDTICDEKTSPNHELTHQFQLKFCMRLVGIIAGMVKWMRLGVFDIPVCEECIYVLKDSLFDKLNKEMDVETDITTNSNNSLNTSAITHQPTSITEKSKLTQQYNDINKKKPLQPKIFSNSPQNYLDEKTKNDVGSRHNTNNNNQQVHKQIDNQSGKIDRHTSPPRRRERSTSRRRISNQQQQYYQERDRFSPRNYGQEPRSNNGEYSKSFHEYDHYDKYDDRNNEQIFRKNPYSNSDRNRFGNDNFDDRCQSHYGEPIRNKSPSDNRTSPTTQTTRCLDTKKSPMEKIDKDDSHNNQQKETSRPPPDRSPNNGEILLKTNAVIVCGIPIEWKTSNDVFKEMGDISVNQMRLIPEHKCLYISFKNHQDALQMKTNKIGKCDVVWGKEQWMQDYSLTNDGDILIPIQNIPQYIHYDSNGTYEVV
ncbi:CID domain-containing protein [Entamoeba marina]